MEGHLCKRWGDRREHCVFNTVPWHTQDQLEEGDTWDDLDPEYDPLKTNVPAWTLMGAAVYKSLLDSYGPKPLPAFDPGYVPQSARLFNAAVGLAEIGVVRQLPQVERTQKPTSEEPPVKSYQQYWEYGETFAWAIGSAASLAVAWLVGGGPPGRPQGRLGRSGMSAGYGPGGQFNMAQKFPWMYSANPLKSVTTDVTGLLVQGYVPFGTEVVKETRTYGDASGEFGVGSAFAHGLTGYI